MTLRALSQLQPWRSVEPQRGALRSPHIRAIAVERSFVKHDKCGGLSSLPPQDVEGLFDEVGGVKGVDAGESAHPVKSVARGDIASQSMPDAATASCDLGTVTARPHQEIQGE
jgi:hypothetical protein